MEHIRFDYFLLQLIIYISLEISPLKKGSSTGLEETDL